tara:strand:+ start:497 stop:892 length:396 start_codon:yes stop_codon:yes gene_type:complete
MPEEELQDVKLEVGLLKNEVEVRGRQIDTLLGKLDTTAEKLQELTVEIRTLNSRQVDHLRHEATIRDEFKILHSRIGDLHDKLQNNQAKVEERLDALDQYKSRLMGMIVVVGGVVGMGIASIMGLLNMFKD